MKKRLTGLGAAALVGLALLAGQAHPAGATIQLDLPPATPFVVSAAAGDQTDPHVSGGLVTYTNEVSGNSEIRVHDIATGSDVAVPADGGLDFLSDTSGGRVTYTHLGDDSSIRTYDPATATTAELDPVPAANRRESRVGGGTIAWQDFGYTGDISTPEIVAYDSASGVATRLTNDELLDKDPAVSPDGDTIVWTKCGRDGTGCAIWEARRSVSGWTTEALTTAADGEAALPDTDGSIVVYSLISAASDENLLWQPVGGGEPHTLSLPGQQTNPNVSNGVVAFEQLDTTTQVPNYDLWLWDVATDTVYRVTQTPEDETLNDISVSPDRQVTLVWTKAELDDNVYGETFALRGLPASLALVPAGGSQPVGTTATVTALVTDAAGDGVGGTQVGIKLSGAVSRSGFCPTGDGGMCSTTFAGPDTPGTVSIAAFVDTNLNGRQDPGEPTATASRTFVADATPPAIAFSQSPDGSGGWFRHAPATVHVGATDTAGVASLACTLDGSPAPLAGESSDATSRSGDVATSAEGDHVVACTAADADGNASPAEQAHLKLDATAPTVSVEGFADGQLVLLGAPRPDAACSSDDAVSGVASTSGPAEAADLSENGVGTVSVTCTATDAAGNTATATASYRIGYDVVGFLRPVRGAPAVNRGHAGRAFPLLWRLADAGGRPVTALSAIASIRYRPVSCSTFAGDATPVDAKAAGHTRLVYSALTRSYVFVWKTPLQRGCYVLSVALDSGQSLDARFRLS